MTETSAWGDSLEQLASLVESVHTLSSDATWGAYGQHIASCLAAVARADHPDERLLPCLAGATNSVLPIVGAGQLDLRAFQRLALVFNQLLVTNPEQDLWRSAQPTVEPFVASQSRPRVRWLSVPASTKLSSVPEAASPTGSPESDASRSWGALVGGSSSAAGVWGAGVREAGGSAEPTKRPRGGTDYFKAIMSQSELPGGAEAAPHGAASTDSATRVPSTSPEADAPSPSAPKKRRRGGTDYFKAILAQSESTMPPTSGTPPAPGSSLPPTSGTPPAPGSSLPPTSGSPTAPAGSPSPAPAGSLSPAAARSLSDDSWSSSSSRNRPAQYAKAGRALFPNDPFVPGEPHLESAILRSEATGCELGEQLARVAENCLDDLATLSRHRMERRIEETAEEEDRILRIGDALAAVGPTATQHLDAWWLDNLDSDDEYRSWSLTYACASWAGLDSFRQLGQAVDRLPSRSADEARCIAEALCLIERLDVADLAQGWLRAAHPVKRSVAIDVLSRNRWLDPEHAMRWLSDPNLVVVEAALRAFSRMPLPPSAHPILEQWLCVPDERVAWEAARTLALAGSSAAYRRLLQSDHLEKTLGPRTVELLILFGSHRDADRLQQVLSRNKATPDLLDRVARLGIPTTYRYLTYHLEDDDLVDAAADALEVMFGPMPDEDLRESPVAWRQRIASLKVDPECRCRCGRPWHLASLATELQRGELDRRGLGRRLDEFSVRLATPHQVDLNAWTDELTTTVQEAITTLGRQASRLRPGSYDCATQG